MLSLKSLWRETKMHPIYFSRVSVGVDERMIFYLAPFILLDGVHFSSILDFVME
jgi:hypothetical protein